MSDDTVTPSGLRILSRRPVGDDVVSRGVLLLVHGSMDRATSFTRLMARLPDWHVVAYDRRGYAGSAGVEPSESFSDQVDDLFDVLADEDVGGGSSSADAGPVLAFGHSFGGDVVLAAAARRPDLIPAAMVWEPPLPWLPWWPTDTAVAGAAEEMDPQDRAEWFMRRMVGDHIWERLPKATQAQRRAEGLALRAEMRSLRDGPVFDPAGVRVPVLVGRGGQSRGHQRRSARELAATLPSGQLVEIEPASHGAHLSHPAELAGLLGQLADLATSR